MKKGQGRKHTRPKKWSGARRLAGPATTALIHGGLILIILLYDDASGSEITSCIKIDKPLVVYRFSENVLTSITTLHT